MNDQATQLLHRLNAGDTDAGRDLLPMVYDELRAIAGRQFRGQPAGHTLQPTALVHEAFVRLLGKPAKEWNDRKHFFAVAATAMRQILVNHAREKAAMKRGGGSGPVAIDEASAGAAPAGNHPIDLLALDDAMEKLARIDPRRHRVVELRFFAGLTVDEIAEVTGHSKTTVETDWRVARAFLRTEMGEASGI